MDLAWARLTGVRLAGAKLNDANLTQTTFDLVELGGATFVGAGMSETTFRRTQLATDNLVGALAVDGFILELASAHGVDFTVLGDGRPEAPLFLEFRNSDARDANLTGMRGSWDRQFGPH